MENQQQQQQQTMQMSERTNEPTAETPLPDLEEPPQEVPLAMQDDDSIAKQQNSTTESRSARFCSELRPCQPWWHTAEPQGRLDVPASFCPTGWKVLLWKLCATMFALLTCAWGFVLHETSFYLAYLSYWAVVMCCLYFCCSLYHSVRPVTVQPGQQQQRAVSLPLRVTWFLFELGLHMSSITVNVWFWFLLESKEINLMFVASHGGTLAMIAIDGLLINRIPLRMQHYAGVLLVEVAYIVWSVLHGLATDIGNPDKDDYDAIYRALDWKNDWEKALFWSCTVALVIGPIFYLCLWWFGNYGFCGRDRRRYYQADDDVWSATDVNASTVDDNASAETDLA